MFNQVSSHHQINSGHWPLKQIIQMNSVTVLRLLLTEELHVRLRQQQQHGEHKNNVPATNSSFSR